MKRLFSSGMQAIALQVLGVAFFYLISLFLSKEDLGIVSWANAVVIMITMVLSLGMEQVVVRRVAVNRGAWPAAAYFFHCLWTLVLTFILLGIAWMFELGKKETLGILICFFTAQGLIYLGVPLKQYLNAREQFAPYGAIAMGTNMLKLAGVWYFHSVKGTLTIESVAGILIVCAIIEFFALLIYVKKFTDFSFSFRLKAYRKLINESMPQYLSVLFDTGMARIDWILLGLIGTMAATADYSFAFRAFEMCRLPLFILGPVMFPWFARMMKRGGEVDGNVTAMLKMLFSIIVFGATILPLLLNIVWTPWVGAITQQKYGASNQLVFGILSWCLPLQFITNFFWTLCFTSKRYKEISGVIVISSVVNLLLNIILIPEYGMHGAAVAYLGSASVQVVLYFAIVRRKLMQFPLRQAIFLPLFGILTYGFTVWCGGPVLQQLITASGIYIVLCVVSGLVGRKHLKLLRSVVMQGNN